MSLSTKIRQQGGDANVRRSGGDDSPETAQILLPPGDSFHHWELGFKQFSLHHVGRANATCRTASSSSCALLPACYCSVGLSTVGKLVAQTHSSSISRLNRGCD